jgi:hypothetical protein
MENTELKAIEKTIFPTTHRGPDFFHIGRKAFWFLYKENLTRFNTSIWLQFAKYKGMEIEFAHSNKND